MLSCWTRVLSTQALSLGGRQCSLLTLCNHANPAKITSNAFQGKKFLCVIWTYVISGVELCISRKLLLGGIYFQLFINYLPGMDLYQDPKDMRMCKDEF